MVVPKPSPASARPAAMVGAVPIDLHRTRKRCWSQPFIVLGNLFWLGPVTDDHWPEKARVVVSHELLSRQLVSDTGN